MKGDIENKSSNSIISWSEQRKEENQKSDLRGSKSKKEPEQVPTFNKQGLQTIRFIISNTLLPVY